MLKILILVCPMSVDHEHCNRDTATDVLNAMRASSPQQCGFMAQALLAPTSLVPDAGKQYVKVLCLPDKTVTAAISAGQ